MPQPSFLSRGETPQRYDTKWLRWTRILGNLQNQSGLPENNPRRQDTLRQIKYKVLRAVNNM